MAAKSLLEALLNAGRWRDPAHLLMGDGSQDGEGAESGGILGRILDVLQPQLTKYVFSWSVLWNSDANSHHVRGESVKFRLK